MRIYGMATLLVYRCPESGLMTQTWVTTEAPVGDRQSYEAVLCLACSKQHFICTATGRAMGDNNSRPTSVRGPAFPPKQIRLCHERAAPLIDVEASVTDIVAAMPAGRLHKAQ